MMFQSELIDEFILPRSIVNLPEKRFYIIHNLEAISNKFRLIPAHGLPSFKRQCYKPIGYPFVYRYGELDNRSLKNGKNNVPVSLHQLTTQREKHLSSGYIRKVCG